MAAATMSALILIPATPAFAGNGGSLKKLFAHCPVTAPKVKLCLTATTTGAIAQFNQLLQGVDDSATSLSQDVQTSLRQAATDLAAAGTNFLQEALANFDSVITNFPASALLAQARLDRGWCYWAQTNLAGAKADFQAAADHLSFGSHTEKFAYYTSANLSRSDYGLAPPIGQVFHDATNGFGVRDRVERAPA